MRISRLLGLTLVTLAALYHAGCGSVSASTPGGGGTGEGGGGGGSTADPNVQATAAGSAAVGLATDAGVAQLFVGNLTALAFQPVKTTLISDALSGEAGMTQASLYLPDVAVAGGAPVTITPQTYTNPAFSSGSITWQSDTTGLTPPPVDPNSVGASSSLSHVTMLFNVFAVTSEDGSVATVNTGQLDVYVQDQVLKKDSAGNWTRVIDVWSVMSTALTVHVVPFNGTARDVSITGGRHTARTIVRALNQQSLLVSNTQIHVVDGNFTNYPTGAGIVASPAPLPVFNINNVPANFTKWRNDATINRVPHVYQWDRYAQFALQYQYYGSAISSATATLLNPATTPTITNGLSTYSIPTRLEQIYISIDGTLAGPLAWSDLVPLGVNPDFSKTGINL